MVVGRIISLENTPNSKEFYFLLKGNIRIGELVKVKAFEDSYVIGKVVDIINFNRYFSNAYSLKEIIESGRNLEDIAPIDKWEVNLAKVKVMGLLENDNVKSFDYSVKAGSIVERVEDEILKRFLNLDENGLYIGNIKSGQKIILNLDKLFRKHCCILAQSGYGKSYTVQVIIEELLSKEKLKIPCLVVFDIHGEYKPFATSSEFSLKTKLFEANEIKFSTFELTAESIGELLPEISSTAKKELRRIINNLKNRKKIFDLNDLINEVDADRRMHENVKSHLVSWLLELESLNIFDKLEYPVLKDVIKPNNLIVFDLSTTTSLRKKQTVVAKILRELFKMRIERKIPPSIIFLEESHQFAPEQEEKSKAISKPIIETIAREGRKFGLSLVLISQRPIQLSKTALSQCDTKIIMHISNPYDIDHIGRSAEQLSKEELESLTSLAVGEAFISGEVIKFPVLIKVREKKIKENITKDFSELIDEYQEFPKSS